MYLFDTITAKLVALAHKPLWKLIAQLFQVGASHRNVVESLIYILHQQFIVRVFDLHDSLNFLDWHHIRPMHP